MDFRLFRDANLWRFGSWKTLVSTLHFYAPLIYAEMFQFYKGCVIPEELFRKWILLPSRKRKGRCTFYSFLTLYLTYRNVCKLSISSITYVRKLTYLHHDIWYFNFLNLNLVPDSSLYQYYTNVVLLIKFYETHA